MYAAALDVSKAFNRVNHFKLFRTLVNSRIPLAFIDVLCHWSGKLCCVVRWRGMMSTVFSIGSGVRQGGTLSPALFNLFINVIIFNLNQSGFGCRVQRTYIGCILYADDIILLSPTVSGLQAMLNVCYASSCELRLQFNANFIVLLLVGLQCV